MCATLLPDGRPTPACSSWGYWWSQNTKNRVSSLLSIFFLLLSHPLLPPAFQQVMALLEIWLLKEIIYNHLCNLLHFLLRPWRWMSRNNDHWSHVWLGSAFDRALIFRSPSTARNHSFLFLEAQSTCRTDPFKGGIKSAQGLCMRATPTPPHPTHKYSLYLIHCTSVCARVFRCFRGPAFTSVCVSHSPLGPEWRNLFKYPTTQKWIKERCLDT